MKRIPLAALCFVPLVAIAQGDLNDMGTRTGIGQASAREPAQVQNLKLSDPLVQKKYLNDNDMLRFLRGTYSEGCARGLITQVTTEIKLDPKKRYDPKLREQVREIVDSQRIWKMSTFELEVVFRDAYLKAGNYCDCMMKEITNEDLVNPRKGLEVLQKIPPASQQACERIAVEKTEQQLSKKKKE